MSGAAWTPEEISRFLDYNDGSTCFAVAWSLGRSMPAIQGMRRKLKRLRVLQARPGELEQLLAVNERIVLTQDLAEIRRRAGLPLVRELRDCLAQFGGAQGWGNEEPKSPAVWQRQAAEAIARATAALERREGVGRKLTEGQADEIEAEMRRLETDPSVSKHALRLYMESPMPCGHAAGNLLTCDRPPIGCVICGEPESRAGGREGAGG